MGQYIMVGRAMQDWASATPCMLVACAMNRFFGLRISIGNACDCRLQPSLLQKAIHRWAVRMCGHLYIKLLKYIVSKFKIKNVLERK
jgi:hypothetical protein